MDERHRLVQFHPPLPIIPLDAIPIVITPEVHTIALWAERGPFGRPTLTGSVQAFGAWMAHHLAQGYYPLLGQWFAT